MKCPLQCRFRTQDASGGGGGLKTNKSCAFRSKNLCAQMQIETQIQIQLCILTCIILIHSSIQLQLQMYVYKITWKKLWLCKNSPGKQQFKIVQFQVLVQIQYKYRCKKSPNSGANKVQIEEHIHKS